MGPSIGAAFYTASSVCFGASVNDTILKDAF